MSTAIWVGRLGPEAVAAVSLSFPILFLVIALGGGLAVAGAILTAQYYGKGERVDHIAAQTMLAVVGVAAVLSLTGYLTTPAIMAVFDPAPAVYPLAVEYLRISFVGLVFLYIYFVFQSLFRSVGDVKTPLYVVTGTVLLNFVATATVVGQIIGAGKPDRAEQTARVANGVGLIALEAAGIVAFYFADGIIRVFIPESPAVIDAGATFLRIMALTWGFVGVQLALTGTFRGAGNTLAAMALAILSLWVLRFPVAWALSARTSLGIAGIWWAFPVSNVFAAVIAYLWFRRGRWRRRALTEIEDHALRDAVSDEAIVEEGWGR